MRTTVSIKGQVTIPKRLRQRLGIDAGTVLRFVEDNGRLLVEKVIEDDPIARAYGLLSNLGRTTDDVMRELRYGDEEQ